MTRVEDNPNPAPASLLFREEMIWQQLKTVRDPEIPVNIVDLGLIYAAEVSEAENAGKRIAVRMTLTAPGCAMSDVIKAEVERKLLSLPEVREVRVDVVFDPPWDKSKMSEAAKLQLGFDMDSSEPVPSRPSTFKIVR
jgi:metal-sulfur cluster biosynthetic enzyme